MRLDLLRLDAELPRQIGNAMVLQQAQVIADEDFARGAAQAEVAQLEQQALLQIAGADANRIEGLDVIEGPLDQRHVPVAQRRDLVDRRHQVAVVVDIADNRRSRGRAGNRRPTAG